MTPGMTMTPWSTLNKNKNVTDEPLILIQPRPDDRYIYEEQTETVEQQPSSCSWLLNVNPIYLLCAVLGIIALCVLANIFVQKK